MVLQGSPPISLLDIRNEFGGVAPDSLSEYYRGGSPLLVPDTPANAGIPTSGPISLLDFLGGDATPPLVLGDSPDEFIRKTFSSSKTSNTTFSDVTQMELPIKVNQRYYIEGLIRSDVSSTSSPSRLALRWRHAGISNHTQDLVTYTGVAEASNSTLGSSAGRFFWSNVVSGAPFTMNMLAYGSAAVTDQNSLILWGTFEAGPGGSPDFVGSPGTGTLRLQFAQTTSDSVTNFIEANSYLAMWEI